MNAETNTPTQSSSPAEPVQKSCARHIPTVARILMGLPLTVFGLNLFFNFLPQPKTPISADAMAFAGALMKSGYMMPLIGATLLIVGVLLLTNRFVPLALVLFAPFIVNSIAFHSFLEHTGLPMAAV
ncbi:MAG: DoxX family protein, partial [Verrucomicrobiota bacterium]|nr:DoxX family protein [Verrucomicrobiota bacterium]